MIKGSRIRHWMDHCSKCHSKRLCDVDLETARFGLGIPSQCPTKDKCEEEILRDAGWQPVRTPEGTIAR